MFPSAVEIFGFFQRWNAVHCCGKAVADIAIDVGFIAVTGYLGVHLAFEPDLIHMDGFSKDGRIAYRLEAERGNILNAFSSLASAAGGRPWEETFLRRIPNSVNPLLIIAIHGQVEDDSICEGIGIFIPRNSVLHVS